MKTMHTAAALILLCCLTSVAEVNPAITNWFPNYIATPASFTNAGDTGLSTGTVYCCIPASLLSTATAAELSHTNGASDVRELLYGIDAAWYLSIAQTASSNRPTYYTVIQSSDVDGTTNITVTIRHYKSATLQLTDNDFPDE